MIKPVIDLYNMTASILYSSSSRAQKKLDVSYLQNRGFHSFASYWGEENTFLNSKFFSSSRAQRDQTSLCCASSRRMGPYEFFLPLA